MIGPRAGKARNIYPRQFDDSEPERPSLQFIVGASIACGLIALIANMILPDSQGISR